MSEAVADFCREIEAYLCRKNDGHLIRVTGPSFDLVAGWAAKGVPLKVAFRGIDRYVERYYRKGPRRRPVRIDFCEADVLDVFEEWRRAIGLPLNGHGEDNDRSEPVSQRPARSLPAHLERALLRLTAARASGAIDERFDPILDAAARELDITRADRRGLRGTDRQDLVDRLAALDAQLLSTARDALSPREVEALTREAQAELAAFRGTMPAEAFARSVERSVDRLIRDRLGLPILAF